MEFKLKEEIPRSSPRPANPRDQRNFRGNSSKVEQHFHPSSRFHLIGSTVLNRVRVSADLRVFPRCARVASKHTPSRPVSSRLKTSNLAIPSFPFPFVASLVSAYAEKRTLSRFNARVSRAESSFTIPFYRSARASGKILCSGRTRTRLTIRRFHVYGIHTAGHRWCGFAYINNESRHLENKK